MRLKRDAFLEVVRNTPLVSIDLIVRDTNDRVLVGLRTNEPARGWWFVPGGRVYKDERLADAFARITRAELGVGFAMASARPLGVYEHLYETNALDAPGVSTHYVVLAYALRVDGGLAPPDAQHAGYAWRSEAELLADPTVHENTRAYFAV